MGTQINENNDIVEVDNARIYLEDEKIYIMLNKPSGYVTTSKEQFGRPSVLDLICEDKRVFSVGRLDMDTEGLLILTNDGEFANNLMHPSKKVSKTYEVKVDKVVTDEMINNLKNGVDIGGYITKPAKVILKSKRDIEITISEGKNRQVRKMCNSQGLEVLKLKRISIDHLKLGDLELGKYRALTYKEINAFIHTNLYKDFYVPHTFLYIKY